MYKILIKSSTVPNSSLWGYYRVDGEEYSSTSLKETKGVVKELVNEYPINQIQVIDTVDMITTVTLVEDSADETTA